MTRVLGIACRGVLQRVDAHSVVLSGTLLVQTSASHATSCVCVCMRGRGVVPCGCISLPPSSPRTVCACAVHAPQTLWACALVSGHCLHALEAACLGGGHGPPQPYLACLVVLAWQCMGPVQQAVDGGLAATWGLRRDGVSAPMMKPGAW